MDHRPNLLVVKWKNRIHEGFRVILSCKQVTVRAPKSGPFIFI